MKTQPVRINTNEDPFAGIGRTPMFYVDELAFTVPIDVPASFALFALEHMSKTGDAMATRWLMKEVLGEEGYQALLDNSHRITRTELRQIQAAIRELVFGEEEEEGKG